MSAHPAACLDSLARNEDRFPSTSYPRSFGSLSQMGGLGFSRCVMSSPPRGAVPTGSRDIACSHDYLQSLDRSCVGAAGFLIPPMGESATC